MKPVTRQPGIKGPEFESEFHAIKDENGNTAISYPQYSLTLPFASKGKPALPQTFQSMSHAFAQADATASVTSQAAAPSPPPTPTGDALDRALAALKALGGDPAAFEKAKAEVLEAVGKGATRDSLAETINTLMEVTRKRGDSIAFLLHEVWNTADNIGDVAKFLPARGIPTDQFSAQISAVLQQGRQNVLNADQIEDKVDRTLRAFANVPQSLSP